MVSVAVLLELIVLERNYDFNSTIDYKMASSLLESS